MKKPRSKPIETVADLADLVAEDRITRRFKRNVAALIRPLNLDQFKAELQQMHADRKIRVLKQRQISKDAQAKLITALVQNQAFRSRAVEIRVSVTVTKNDLDELVSAYHDYAMSYYGAKMKDVGLKTISDRDRFVSSFYSDAAKWQRQVDTIIEIVDMIVDDMDQAGWSIQRTTKILELTSKERYDG